MHDQILPFCLALLTTNLTDAPPPASPRRFVEDVLPLESADGHPIPLQFVYDPGDDWNPAKQASKESAPQKWAAFDEMTSTLRRKELLRRYLDLTSVRIDKRSQPR